MSKQRLTKGAQASRSTSKITDPRFSNFETDPRFRLPSKTHTRTKLDSRFSKLLKDEDFTNTASVDRYGRKVEHEGRKKALERLYLLPEGEGEDDDDDEETVSRHSRRVEKYDPARQGGFSSSSEEEEEEQEEEDEGHEQLRPFPDMQAEQAGVEMGEVTTRFAVVNMDWDNVRAVDLMAVFQSFVPGGGAIQRIMVYQSDFGKERMDREELEGPPRQIFASHKDAQVSDEDDESGEEADEKIRKSLLREDEGKEFDSTALRQYQLERLRYYYAVVECTDKTTAQAIYEATDGTEYLASANFFDLRFIPDHTDFDERPRDESHSVPAGYKPTEFLTHALQHSKVKLTWDMDPLEATRKDAIKRSFTGSRSELNDNDLRAYLGSESDSSELEEVQKDNPASDQEKLPVLTKKESSRRKMRAALGLSEKPQTSKTNQEQGPVGDMQITFTAGLSASATNGVFENEPSIDETTAEKYVRKERERKARRREKARATRDGHDPDDNVVGAEAVQREKEEDLGFNDPFFSTDEKTFKEAAKKKARKEGRHWRREEDVTAGSTSATQRAVLESLMQPDDNQAEHFNIKYIEKAEKSKRKEGTVGKRKRPDLETAGIERQEAGDGLQQGFEIDVKDERFGKLYQNHDFAIDPSHAKFRGTEGMKALVEEGRRKRDAERGEGQGDDGGIGRRKEKGRNKRNRVR